jgi:hypothetical protein
MPNVDHASRAGARDGGYGDPEAMTETPLMLGYLDGPNLIIPDCRVCGGEHHHGSADHELGDITTRSPHCGGRPSDRPAQYRIAIVREGEAR